MKQMNFSYKILKKYAWLFACVTIASAGFTQLVRDATFDGFICTQNNRVFEMRGVKEISCARACHQNASCLSMLYSPLASSCTGCMNKFTTGDVLEVSAGAQYHERKGMVLAQWGMNVTGFSTEYSTDGWCADQILGPPDVYPIYGDIPQAWCPGILDSYQFIQVNFSEAVYITGVEIYETCSAGSVKAIKSLDGLGNWITLWSTANVQYITTARVFAPKLSVTMDRPSRDIRIEIDCTASNDWVEIDAVRLLGIK